MAQKWKIVVEEAVNLGWFWCAIGWLIIGYCGSVMRGQVIDRERECRQLRG
jgi:hypothetical protein